VQTIRGFERAARQPPQVDEFVLREIFLLLAMEQMVLSLSKRSFRNIQLPRELGWVVEQKSFRDIAWDGARPVADLIPELEVA
jgi:hypothetical protein